MADIELNIASGVACENTDELYDGAYVCSVRHLSSAGIKRTRLNMGRHNPAEESVPDLMKEMVDRVSTAYKIYGARKIPMEQFVGLSIVRSCIREELHADGTVGLAPRAERVANIAFAADVDSVFEVEHPRLAAMRTVSENGIGTVIKPLLNGQGLTLERTLYLPATAAERTTLPTHAVAALPSQDMVLSSQTPHVALRSTESGGFIERVVGLDEMRD